MMGVRDRKSFLAIGFLGAMAINLVLFGLLPGLIHMDGKPSDLESLNVVNFTRMPAPKPEVRPRETPKEQPPEKEPEKIYKVPKAMPRQVHPKRLALEMPAPDLNIDPRISGGIPMISAPEPAPKTDTAEAIDFNAILDQGEVDVIPTPSFKQNPRYPYRAKRMGMEGEVKIRFLVDREGKVSQIEILSASPPGVFEEAVLNAVSSWKYTPGELMGRQVATRVTTSVRFKLE